MFQVAGKESSKHIVPRKGLIPRKETLVAKFDHPRMSLKRSDSSSVTSKDSDTSSSSSSSSSATSGGTNARLKWRRISERMKNGKQTCKIEQDLGGLKIGSYLICGDIDDDSMSSISDCDGHSTSDCSDLLESLDSLPAYLPSAREIEMER